VNEFDSRIIAKYVDMTGRVGGEAAGEGREMRKSFGEREFEDRDEGVDREWWMG
jgi:hypothetical protein